MRDRLSVLIGVLALVVAVLAVMLGVLMHMHLSLVEAVNQLGYCWSEEVTLCEIERDGVDYNTYGYIREE